MTSVLLTEILKQVKERLRVFVPSPKYEFIIEPMEIESLGGGKVVVNVSGSKQAQWLERECLGILEREFSALLGGNQEVVVRVSEGVTDSETSQSPAGADVVAIPEVKAVKKPKPLLNPRFTFENFVVGPSNEFSYSAAKAVAERPGLAYNPLFIYADVGLGKTHLLHAVGHLAIELHSSARVVYVTSERFTSDFIERVRTGRMEEFRQKYRRCDLLLIDDIQFIAGKVETQMEFFHTFLSLADAGKQVVITSDAPTYELKGIEARLISRFASGLQVDIGQPSLETRIAILHKKAELEGVDVAKDILNFIAENVFTNIRDLEGALIRLLAFCNFSGAKCTLDVAHRVLADLVTGRKAGRYISVEEIVEVVCEVFKVPRDILLSKDRRKKVAEARMVAMYLAREKTGLTLAQIGEELGGRDHSTVSYAVEKTCRQIDEDPYLKQMFQTIIRKLG